MLRRLFERVADAVGQPGDDKSRQARRDEAVRLATAVLMVEVARADNRFSDVEAQHIESLVRARFGLSADDAAALTARADATADDLVSLHEFTHLLHESLGDSEKAEIVASLWRVAYADGELDKFEDALVLRISDLLYVSRGLVMRLKHDAALASGAA